MGVIRFQLPEGIALAPDAVKHVYFSSGEGIPWRCAVEQADGEIRVRRPVNDSGLLHVPWTLPERGPVVLTTANLRERLEPYQLSIEVARGTLFRLRNQTAIWESAGLELDERVVRHTGQAEDAFVRSIFMPADHRDKLQQVNVAIRAAVDAMDALVDLFVDQVFATRRLDPKAQTPKWLACPIAHYRPAAQQEQEVLSTFNGGVVTPNWRDVEANEGHYRWNTSMDAVEWCSERGLRLCVGPMVRNEAPFLPNWLYLWQDDDESLPNYCSSYVQAAVKQFQGRVGLWNACSGFHAAGALDITEESAVRLMAAIVSGIRQVDPRTPLIVSFTRPFGEYMAREARELSPFHLADALLRADLGISGLALELSFGDHQVPPRDWLQWNLQLDLWSQLGVPLLVVVSGPSEGRTLGAASPAAATSYWATQEQLLQRFLPLCLAKRNVHGVVWNQLADSDAGHDLHGLIDRQGVSKPGLQWLQAFRRDRLA